MSMRESLKGKPALFENVMPRRKWIDLARSVEIVVFLLGL